MKYINLGCGTRFCPDWTNIDSVSQSKYVMSYNLSKGIPFPDCHFDVVYHSHLLEHIPKSEVDYFMYECFRVLKKGGVVRLVVPDLELITTLYLKTLNNAIDGIDSSGLDYEWIVMHLYDQSVRNKSGGEMREYLSRETVGNLTFIENLMGSEAKTIINSIKKSKIRKVRDVIRNNGGFFTFKLVLSSIFANNPLKELILKLLLREEYKALQIGRFCQSGEIHQWMYDRYSLSMIMKKSGFMQINQCSATQSSIHNWLEYHLDVEPNGKIYKPDSIYMEGVKP